MLKKRERTLWYAALLAASMCTVGLLTLLVSADTASEPPVRYAEARYEAAELKHVDTIPVLQLSGTAEEIGRQEAHLAGEHAKALLGFGPQLIKRLGGNSAWVKHVAASRYLFMQTDTSIQAELDGFQKASGCSADELIASQTLYDTLAMFGCSSLIVPPEQSETKGPLLGRNLDYASFGLLHRYGMVKTYRPTGKFAFASIGFPGCLGVLSGMNEHGLALALHEVRSAADDSPKFNPQGVPTMLVLRRLLEECKTVDEAEKLLGEIPRVTMFNLAVCDRDGGGVLEVTVKNVALRRNAGPCACTNHFRTDDLSVTKDCRRYDLLRQSPDDPFTIDRVHKMLHVVNQGQQTFQTMIFEPRTLVVHVAMDRRPSSEGPLHKVDLKSYLSPGK